jgi:hypothetical protein
MEPVIFLVLTCPQAIDLKDEVVRSQMLTQREKVQIVRKIMSHCHEYYPWNKLPDTTHTELSQKRCYGPCQTQPLPLWESGKFEKSCRTEIQSDPGLPGRFSQTRSTSCTFHLDTF